MVWRRTCSKLGEACSVRDTGKSAEVLQERFERFEGSRCISSHSKGDAEPPSKGLQEGQEGLRPGSQSRDAKRHPRNALR